MELKCNEAINALKKVFGSATEPLKDTYKYMSKGVTVTKEDMALADNGGTMLRDGVENKKLGLGEAFVKAHSDEDGLSTMKFAKTGAVASAGLFAANKVFGSNDDNKMLY